MQIQDILKSISVAYELLKMIMQVFTILCLDGNTVRLLSKELIIWEYYT